MVFPNADKDPSLFNSVTSCQFWEWWQRKLSKKSRNLEEVGSWGLNSLQESVCETRDNTEPTENYIEHLAKLLIQDNYMKPQIFHIIETIL